MCGRAGCLRTCAALGEPLKFQKRYVHKRYFMTVLFGFAKKFARRAHALPPQKRAHATHSQLDRDV